MMMLSSKNNLVNEGLNNARPNQNVVCSWCGTGYPIQRRRIRRADVFDLSCANAQRLFSKVEKSKRRKASAAFKVNYFRNDSYVELSLHRF